MFISQSKHYFLNLKIILFQRSSIYKLSSGDYYATHVGRKNDKSNLGFHVKFNNHHFSNYQNDKIIHNIRTKDFNKFIFVEDLEFLQIRRYSNFKPLSTSFDESRPWKKDS